jgi:Zn-dependent alcohol dehydrogenase
MDGVVLTGARHIIAIELRDGNLSIAQKTGTTDIVNASGGKAIEHVRS